jgi:hypothetical protein
MDDEDDDKDSGSEPEETPTDKNIKKSLKKTAKKVVKHSNSEEALRAEMLTTDHMMSHLPKNKFCEVCRLAKTVKVHSQRSKKSKNDPEARLPRALMRAFLPHLDASGKQRIAELNACAF